MGIVDGGKMVAKISVGSSLYGAIAYNGEKINEAQGDVYKRQRFTLCSIALFSGDSVKNISVSYLRAKKKNDLDRIMGCLLYTALVVRSRPCASLIFSPL